MPKYHENTKDGSNVIGQWYSTNKGTLGIVAQEGVSPYICWYPEPVKYGVLPHAVFLEDGDIKIQIPQETNSKVYSAKYLSLNKILEHMSKECECDPPANPAEAPKPE